MAPRVYVEPPCQATTTLDARQSHHLVRVLRVRNGDALEVFDGSGQVWRAQVSRANTNACTIEREDLISEAMPPAPEIHLAQALLKSDAMDRLIRRATELGVAHIWPVTSARTQLSGNRAKGRYDHWRRIIIGACEQSRRPYLPCIHPTQGFDDFIDAAGPSRTLLLHPDAQPLPRELPIEGTAVLVGPEGGWSDAEVSLARARGIDAFGLGALVLRAETAPLAALAAIRHCWGWR